MPEPRSWHQHSLFWHHPALHIRGAKCPGAQGCSVPAPSSEVGPGSRLSALFLPGAGGPSGQLSIPPRTCSVSHPAVDTHHLCSLSGQWICAHLRGPGNLHGCTQAQARSPDRVWLARPWPPSGLETGSSGAAAHSPQADGQRPWSRALGSHDGHCGTSRMMRSPPDRPGPSQVSPFPPTHFALALLDWKLGQ